MRALLASVDHDTEEVAHGTGNSVDNCVRIFRQGNLAPPTLYKR